MFLGAKHPIYFQTLSKPFQNLYFPAKLAGGKYRFIVMGKTSGINLYFYRRKGFRANNIIKPKTI